MTRSELLPVEMIKTMYSDWTATFMKCTPARSWDHVDAPLSVCFQLPHPW